MTPVENRPRRSVPGSASTHPGPPGRGYKESKVGALSPLPSVSLPSAAAEVDISAAPTPRDVGREISPDSRPLAAFRCKALILSGHAANVSTLCSLHGFPHGLASD